jgi:hypothetical protein
MLQIILAAISVTSLLALVAIAFHSSRVQRHSVAIGLLGLFVTYVILRDFSPIRAYMDWIAALALPSLPISGYFLAILPGITSGIVGGVTEKEIKEKKLRGNLVAEVPSRMYEDESATASVIFTRNSLLRTIALRPLVVPIPSTLIVTLQAAAFDVADSPSRSQVFDRDAIVKAQQSPPKHYATFFWNIRPKSSGNFELNLLVELMNGETAPVGRLPIRVRVNKILGLTAQQVWVLAGVLGALTSLATIGGFLLQLVQP